MKLFLLYLAMVAGGFLIEAGLMSIKTIGYDIDKIMINGCNQNLEYFKIYYPIKKNNL